MNERIEELLKTSTDDILGVPVVNHKKFAELIVRECISTLDNNDGATHHSELLLEHFGVKE